MKSGSSVFKPWIVRRENGGCQVLFPLTELDRLVDEAVALEITNRKGQLVKEWFGALEPPFNRKAT